MNEPAQPNRLYDESRTSQDRYRITRNILVFLLACVLAGAVMSLLYLLLQGTETAAAAPAGIEHAFAGIYRLRGAIWILAFVLSFKIYQTGIMMKRNGAYLRFVAGEADLTITGNRAQGQVDAKENPENRAGPRKMSCRSWNAVNFCAVALFALLLLFEEKTGAGKFLHPFLFIMLIYISVLYYLLTRQETEVKQTEPPYDQPE